MRIPPRTPWLWFIAVASGAAFGACGGPSDDPSLARPVATDVIDAGEGPSRDSGPALVEAAAAPACIPGKQISCACAGGASGVQACNDGGSGYGPCACGTESDSGVDSSSGTADGAPADSGVAAHPYQALCASLVQECVSTGDPSLGQTHCESVLTPGPAIDTPTFVDCFENVDPTLDCLDAFDTCAGL